MKKKLISLLGGAEVYRNNNIVIELPTTDVWVAMMSMTSCLNVCRRFSIVSWLVHLVSWMATQLDSLEVLWHFYIISVHATTETSCEEDERSLRMKSFFYELLSMPKVWYFPSIGKCSPWPFKWNGARIINFVVSKDMVIGIKFFSHNDIPNGP